MKVLKRLAMSVAASAVAFSGFAYGQSYPTKPIKFVVAAAPGSGSDILARYLASRLSPVLGQPIVMDNKPGANGAIAAQFVANSPADGYTVTLAGASTHVIGPALNPNLGYDPVKDFTPIGQLGLTNVILIANMSVPAANLKELIEIAKRGQTQYASYGNGSTAHFCGEAINHYAKVRMQHIPYKTVPQIITDVTAGHIGVGFVDVTSATAAVQSGKVKALGSCLSKPSTMPNVPTYRESGIDLDRSFRWVVSMPSGTPRAIVQRWTTALNEQLARPEVKARLQELAVDVEQPISNENLAAILAGDAVFWTKFARDVGIKAD
jgi:tripartite-type tricarboxylate transporter receptor subunit TctC